MGEPIFRDVRVARKKDDVKKDFDAARNSGSFGSCGCCSSGSVGDEAGVSVSQRPSQSKGLSEMFLKAISLKQ